MYEEANALLLSGDTAMVCTFTIPSSFCFSIVWVTVSITNASLLFFIMYNSSPFGETINFVGELTFSMVFNTEEELLEDPLLIKTPIVRFEKESSVGFTPEIWMNWEIG